MPKTARRRRRPHSPIPEEILEKLPEDRILLYAHLWELETWLREMVYVELVSRYGPDWANYIEGRSQKRALAGDSRLRHMPTRERLSISYISFSELRKTISKRWILFKEYLPPKDIWLAKLSEIDQIRNRVAHFRRGHPDDINRVRQLLRDIDHGFWRFCTSYNNSLPIIPVTSDPVAKEFAEFDPFPWTETGSNEFVRIGHAPDDLVMSITVELLRRPWLKARHPRSVIGHHGYFYNVHLFARNHRGFDYEAFLQSTKRLHPRLCHICLNSNQDLLKVTMAAVAGIGIVLPTLKSIAAAARNNLRRKPSLTGISFTDISEYTKANTKVVDAIAVKWPEYVLGPSNPLTFLSPDMPCEFFGVP
jgi:hypothetical protein